MALHPVFPAAAAAMALAAALAACTYQSREATGRAKAIPAARVSGADQSCIPLAQIRETRVRDGRTIDFLSGSRTGWRNVLPTECPSLAYEEAFTYATSLSQLCSTDIIYPLQHWGGQLQRGPGCGLGSFTPIELTR